jgi:hypothetical protein
MVTITAKGRDQMNKTSSEEPINPQDVEQQIQNFKNQLAQKSNSELADISAQLENTEKGILLEKINSQLEVIKDNVTKASAKDSGGTAEQPSATGQPTVDQTAGSAGTTSLAGQSSSSEAASSKGEATSEETGSAAGGAP